MNENLQEHEWLTEIIIQKLNIRQLMSKIMSKQTVVMSPFLHFKAGMEGRFTLK